MRALWVSWGVTVALLAAPAAGHAQSGGGLHCDDLSTSVQANTALAIVPPCTDPAPTPGTSLIYMRADPAPTTVTGATLIWSPPFGFTGTTSFRYLAAEQVGSGPQLAKMSNLATVTVQVTPPPPPPPPPPDRDGDKVPDASDPCPDAPQVARAPGWYGGDGAPLGCPPPLAPFSAAAALNSIDPQARKLERHWKQPAWRSRALHRGWVQITLRVPPRTAGSGPVRASLGEGLGPPSNAHERLALRGVSTCTPGARCVVRARFDHARLRALRRLGGHAFSVALAYVVDTNPGLFVARAVRLRLP